MVKSIIFDFDGVLESNYELHYELSTKTITNLTREEHRKLFEGNIHIEREKLKHRNTGFDIKTHFSEAKKGAIMNPGIKQILLDLSKKYTLGIITSSKEQGVHDYLKNNATDGIFSFIYGYETGELKSEKFKKAFTDFDITENNCIFVTDTLGDIQEANMLNIRTIAIDSGYHERERLQKGNPFKIISNLSELTGLEKEF